MRLWHKDLISVLPRQQLLGQVRELTAIIKNINEKGTPNHILVNKILDYPLEHLSAYCYLIINEMENRGYKISEKTLEKWDRIILGYKPYIHKDDIFKYWHNDRYLAQCLYNLEEKYDCKGLTTKEWEKIVQLLLKRWEKYE